MTKKGPEEWSLHGFTVESILADPQFQVDRDLDCCEFFSGVGSIHRAAEARNFKASKYDKYRSPGVTDLDGSSQSEDFCSINGFVTAIILLMRIVPGGLATLAPKCASWMFLNVVNTCRKKENGYDGDFANSSVKEGNAMMLGCLILLELAVLRGIFVVLENPKKSYVWFWQPMCQTLERLKFTYADTMRCAFEHGKGTKIWKEFRFAAAGPGHKWVTAIVRDCPCGAKENHIRTSDVHVDKTGKKRCTGKKDVLRESGSYPKDLGIAIVDAWFRAKAEPQPAAHDGRLGLKRTAGWMTPEPPAVPKSKHSVVSSSSWMTPSASVPTTGDASSSWMAPLSSAPKKRSSEPSSSSWLTPSMPGSSMQQKSVKMGWLQPDAHSGWKNAQQCKFKLQSGILKFSRQRILHFVFQTKHGVFQTKGELNFLIMFFSFQENKVFFLLRKGNILYETSSLLGHVFFW